ncbi:hypothetical protein [Tuwongella immobilis]|uniref:Methanolan biosynthesis EpsI domain-containing protein n=1 Tax=Tuwongella immobilis TaxID=692036 RepID=A0A6C2YWG1_9BACT|nr:hypothetical protein [Tuwongella immobilis]VIP05731.1 Uncharacterized protein OS=Singulisphaera acidiphila (strain ATCC BAA-1392 / DSM 18658 / VKM B-2454 / MOB10) GN=Sinac_2487 PE=4 SV=1 [Tuwongella immobilis]VTS08818.1 Uncharacterized protein OS=Singulisphaera acidiphila (strain ATCC BAA-1392 / DSM 18658 / VKM B-2454 / MOB10) GN=Sinac_2487 PE=4 SV=1 [Tuwongella immobilis]
MPRRSHLFIMGVLIALTAVCHGYLTNRWSVFAAGQFDPDILRSIDDRIGDWEASEATISPEDRMKAYAVSRKFTHPGLGRTIQVTLISGHPSKVATHTPDVCFPGSGYALKSSMDRTAYPTVDGTNRIGAYVADFQKTTATSTETLKVRWTWTSDGVWEAPEYPRWYYGRSPVLHKLYVVHSVVDGDPVKEEAYREFVAQLIDRLNPRIKR